jgi:hypothetical protein
MGVWWKSYPYKFRANFYLFEIHANSNQDETTCDIWFASLYGWHGKKHLGFEIFISFFSQTINAFRLNYCISKNYCNITRYDCVLIYFKINI